ncbi:hypothetical protein ACWER9_23400 [Micromonospora sp. NPDC003944]
MTGSGGSKAGGATSWQTAFALTSEELRPLALPAMPARRMLAFLDGRYDTWYRDITLEPVAEWR